MADTDGSFSGGLKSAMKKALLDFQSRDPFEMAADSGAKYDPSDGCIHLRFLDEDYSFRHPDGAFSGLEAGSLAGPDIQRILLHYVLRSVDVPLSGRLISFHDLPRGLSFELAFQKRAVEPVTEIFSHDLRRF